MQPYKVLVSLSFLQVERPSRFERGRLLSFLESLADNPWKPGDYEERDDVGHPIQIKITRSSGITP